MVWCNSLKLAEFAPGIQDFFLAGNLRVWISKGVFRCFVLGHIWSCQFISTHDSWSFFSSSHHSSLTLNPDLESFSLPWTQSLMADSCQQPEYRSSWKVCGVIFLMCRLPFRCSSTSTSWTFDIGTMPAHQHPWSEFAVWGHLNSYW